VHNYGENLICIEGASVMDVLLSGVGLTPDAALAFFMAWLLTPITRRYSDNDTKMRIVWVASIVCALIITASKGVYAPVVAVFSSGVSFSAALGAVWQAVYITGASWGTIAVVANGVYNRIIKPETRMKEKREFEEATGQAWNDAGRATPLKDIRQIRMMTSQMGQPLGQSLGQPISDPVFGGFAPLQRVPLIGEPLAGEPLAGQSLGPGVIQDDFEASGSVDDFEDDDDFVYNDAERAELNPETLPNDFVEGPVKGANDV
jgi:hypothetical protein